MQRSSMEEVFKLIDKKDNKAAIDLIKGRLSQKDSNFIEDLVISLNIICENSPEVVREILPSLLAILNFEDDVVRYSMIVSLEKFIQERMTMIFPFVEQYLKSSSPKNREGMILLLKYAVEKDPIALTPYYQSIIECLGDKEDFVRKKAIDLLIRAGKKNRAETESKLLTFLQKVNSIQAKEAVEQVLKGMIDFAVLERQELERIQLESQSKILTEKAKELDKTESDLKKIELEIKEKELHASLEREKLEKSIKESQQRLEEKELKIHLEKLKLEEEQKELDLKKLEEEKAKLKNSKELIIKQLDVAKVKQELEQKRLEEERNKIALDEAKRIEQKLKELAEKEDKEEDYTPI